MREGRPGVRLRVRGRVAAMSPTSAQSRRRKAMTSKTTARIVGALFLINTVTYILGSGLLRSILDGPEYLQGRSGRGRARRGEALPLRTGREARRAGADGRPLPAGVRRRRRRQPLLRARDRAARLGGPVGRDHGR